MFTLFRQLRKVDFHGTYPITEDDLIAPKVRTQMIAEEYCGSVHDNRPLKGGHCTRFWCSQDMARKKPSKVSENPTAKRRDSVGMKRSPCRSAMSVKYKRNKNVGYDIFVNLRHHVNHVLYDDIRMPPGALQMIQEQAEWSTPAAIDGKHSPDGHNAYGTNMMSFRSSYIVTRAWER